MVTKILFASLLALLMAGCSQHYKSLQGYIEGDYTYISPAIGGKLMQLDVARGNQVKSKQILFVLDPQPEEDQLKQAQKKLTEAKQTLINLEKGQRPTVIAGIVAQIARAKAALILNQKTLARYRKLYKAGAITKQELDTAISNDRQSKESVKDLQANLAEAKLGARENQIKAQKAVVKAATEQVKQAAWSLQQKTKYAPVAGFVFDTFYRVGEYVSAGQPVVSILAPKNIKLIFYVPEPLLSTIALGQQVKIGCDGCKGKTPATISFISSEAEYTPPVIYSKASRDKLVYRVEAKIAPAVAEKFHTGQPVDVYLNNIHP